MRLSTFLLAMALAQFVSGQEGTGVSRPKVGLVLGGGGARGFAHIGVLEWLEEHRVPVDYLAGTSMGGLVGGLYAMGMTPAEVRSLAKRIDWDEALRGTPSYEQSVLRRKQDRRDYPGLQVGWDKGFRLGAGLNGGYFVDLILERAALPYWQVSEFDRLPIPFRCVAADMVTATTVVLSSGSIPEALRATMAIPGVFTPVQRGNALLVDGGVLNNVPTDVAKAMGADFIIAVNVGTPLRSRKDLQTMVGILDQTISLAAAGNLRANLQLANTVIAPELGDHSSSDFRDAESLARAGYAATARHSQELERFSLTTAAWAEYVAARTARIRKDMPQPNSIRVDASSASEETVIGARLRNYQGRAFAPAALERDLTRVFGWGRYSTLGYDVRTVEEPSRDPELYVQAVRLFDGAAVSRIGLGIRGASSQKAEFNLGARSVLFNLGGYGAELRVDTTLGTTLAYGMEYYRPLGQSRFFIAPRLQAGTTTNHITVSRDNLASYRASSAGIGFDLGYGVLSQTDEVRIGYDLRYEKRSVVIGSPLLPVYSGATSVFSARWLHDNQDSATIPHRGLQYSVRANWFARTTTSARAFPQAEFAASWFQPVDLRGSVFIAASAGTTFNRIAPLGQQFGLGGPLRLGSYGLYELRGSDYGMASVGYLRRLTEGSLLKLYAVGFLQAGRVFRPQSSDRTGMDATAGIAADTFIGPIVFGGAVGDAGHRKVFISIGRIF